MNDTKTCPYCSEIIKETAIKCRFCGSMLTESQTPVNTFTPVRLALASKYEIIEEIGRGGMSIVYKAVQKNLDRTVALKILPQHMTHDKEFLERFHREARSTARLTHPNIITIYDEGIEQGVHYMAMELLNGKDLHQRICEKGVFSPEQLVNTIVPIAKALDYAHKNDLVHRDVKCSNIFLTDDRRILLTDFGIAHAKKENQLTVSGSVLGTPEFMSPEQADGKRIDGRSDIYSLGVVMYYALTGRLPYSSDNPLTTIYKILNERYPPISSIREIPDWLENIVDACLIKHPEKRVHDGELLANYLSRYKTVNKTYQPQQIRENKTQKITTNKNEILHNPESIYNTKRGKSKAEILVLTLLITVCVFGVFYFFLNYSNLFNNNDILPKESIVQKGTPTPKQIPKQNYTQDKSEQNSISNPTPVSIEPKQPAKPMTASIEEVKIETVIVPEVTGLHINVAKKVLINAGLTVGSVTTMESSSDNNNVVIKQGPKSGTSVNKKSSVSIIVGG